MDDVGKNDEDQQPVACTVTLNKEQIHGTSNYCCWSFVQPQIWLTSNYNDSIQVLVKVSHQS